MSHQCFYYRKVWPNLVDIGQSQAKNSDKRTPIFEKTPGKPHKKTSNTAQNPRVNANTGVYQAALDKRRARTTDSEHMGSHHPP